MGSFGRRIWIAQGRGFGEEKDVGLEGPTGRRRCQLVVRETEEQIWPRSAEC